MIIGAHILMYSPKPEETRAFLRDVLQVPGVDAGDGWLIVALPPAEVAVHPIDSGGEHHELSLMCSDVEETVNDLRARGVEFAGEIADHRWGRAIQMLLPDGAEMMLYEPRHPLAAGVNWTRTDPEPPSAA